MKQRMKSFVELYNGNGEKFGKVHMMFGFGNFMIKDHAECKSRIIELAELTGTQVSGTIEEEKMTDGTINKKERLEVI